MNADHREVSRDRIWKKSIALSVALFDRNKDIQVYRLNLAEENKKRDVFK